MSCGNGLLPVLFFEKICKNKLSLTKTFKMPIAFSIFGGPKKLDKIAKIRIMKLKKNSKTSKQLKPPMICKGLVYTLKTEIFLKYFKNKANF